MSEHSDHDHHHGGHENHLEMFRRRFWLSLVLTVPAVAYSHMLMTFTGWTAPHFAGDDWVAPVLGTATFLWGGPIFLRAGKALTERVTEVRLFTHRVPSLAFLPDRRRAEPNQIVLRIDPDPGLRLKIHEFIRGHVLELRRKARRALQLLKP